MEKLLVAEALKPQGIKGEIKVKLHVDGFFAVKNVKTLYDGEGNAYKIKNFKDATGGFAFLLVDGVFDRNTAELLRGKMFYANKNDIKKEKSAFFISDLIGVKVIADNNEIGVIKNVIKSNVDIFELDTISGKCYFPFLNKLNYEIDLDSKTMTVDFDAFKEISVYEG